MNMRRVSRIIAVEKANTQVVMKSSALKPLPAIVKKLCMLFGSVMLGEILIMSAVHAGSQGDVVVGSSGNIGMPETNNSVVSPISEVGLSAPSTGVSLYFVQSDGLMLPEDQGEDEPTNINDEVTR